MPAIFKNGVEYVSTTNAASISVGLGQNVNLNLQDTVQNSLNNFAPIEYSPSQHSYAVGDLLVLNGILYRVVSAISVGNNLLVNGNIQRVTVEKAIQKQLSFVGMIVMSTTLNSELEVQKIYGSDTSWIQHSGYMLRGASQGVTGGLNHNQADGGEATVTLRTQQMPVHTHVQNSHNHTDSGHIHSIGGHTHGINKHTHTLSSHTHTIPQHTHTLSSHTHTATVKYLTSSIAPPGGAAGSMQGYALWTSGTNKTDLVTISGPSNNTSGKSDSTLKTGTPSNNTSGETALTTNNNSAFNSVQGKANISTVTVANQDAGGGQPHNNMPPYKNVYIWQRVA